MRVLALILTFLSVPAFAADYTPWTARDQQPDIRQFLAQTIEGYCCRHCERNQQPCGHSCIGAKATCKEKPGGCACPYDAP
jgi:hypothetical protein